MNNHFLLRMIPAISVKKKMIERGPPGRPKHCIWNQGFRRVMKHSDKHQRTNHGAYCTYCCKVLCNTASKRLEAHRRVCSEPLEGSSQIIDGSTVKIRTIEKDGEDMETSENDSGTTFTFIDSNDATAYVAVPQSSSSSSTVKFYEIKTEDCNNVRCDGSDDKIGTELLKFFIGCDIPFNAVDNVYFRNFIQALGPSNVKPITKTDLETYLLDAVYAEFYEKAQVNNKSVLLIDNWKSEKKNTRNISVMLTADDNNCLFLNNYESTNLKDNSEELANIVQMSVIEAHETFKTETFAVVLGSGIGNVKLDINIWQFICHAYSLSLLIKDVIPEDFVKTLLKILKQYNSRKNNKIVDNFLGKKIEWTDYKEIVEFCADNLSDIQTVFSAQTCKTFKDMQSLLFNESFIKKLDKYYHFSESIGDLINESLLPSTMIADITDSWLKVQLPENEEDIEKKFIAIREEALQVQSLAANYLHPLYKGRYLTEDQMTKVEEFLIEALSSEGLNSLQSYVDETSIFKMLNHKQGIAPQTYWSFVKRNHSDLALLALKLLSVPASLTVTFKEVIDSMDSQDIRPEVMRKVIMIKHCLKEAESDLEKEFNLLSSDNS